MIIYFNCSCSDLGVIESKREIKVGSCIKGLKIKKVELDSTDIKEMAEMSERELKSFSDELYRGMR